MFYLLRRTAANEARSFSRGNMARNAFRKRAKPSCVLDRVGVVCELDSVFVCFYACFLFLSVFGWDCWLACCGWLVFLGFNVLFLFGEFDPGSGRTLAACLTHASRTLKLSFCWVDEWRTGE